MPRQLKSEDLYKLQLISSCQISPDGRHVVYALQRLEQKTEKKYSSLWIVPASGGIPIQFTQGNHSDSQPQWSPDGSKIAFLSNRSDEQQPQLYIIPFHGGEAVKVTDLKGSFGSFEWAPDSKKLVLSFRKKDADDIAREKDEQKKKLGITARHYTRTFYKLDGEGYLPHERWHLWTLDTVSKKVFQITPDSIFDETQASWSPDGQQIVYCTNRAKDPDHDPDALDLCLIPAKGGKANIIPLPVGRKSHPVFAPNGKMIAYVGCLGRGDWWKAVTQRSVSNFTSSWGSSDFNWIFEAELGGHPPWEGINSYWKQSPMKYIGNAKTPTLVTHSEMDFRCDQEQGEQIYVALKRLGVPTELVLFPESSHGVSRNGRTDRRIARLNHIARWFNRYLK